MNKISIRKDLLKFLKHPDYNKFDNINSRERIKLLIKVLLLTYLGLFLTGLPYAILKQLHIAGEIQMQTDLILEYIKQKNGELRTYYLFSLVLFTPLLEEFSFRLFQAKFKLRNFLISISLIVGTLLYMNIKKILWIPQSYFLLCIISYCYILLLACFVYLLLFVFKTRIIKIKTFWNNRFGLIFYLIAISFALLHYNNLYFELRDLWVLPLIFLQLFVYSLSFGYVRIRLGIFYSILLHFTFLVIRFGLLELKSFM